MIRLLFTRTTPWKNQRSHRTLLRFSLTGKNGNTMALGAKVELWSNGKYQFMENFLTRGYASSVDPLLHFGLAADQTVDSIKITWPATGNVSIVKNIPVNQTLNLMKTSRIPGKGSQQDDKQLMFEKTENILVYEHVQNDFADFFLNQKIIPHKFSQIGPCMANGDINNDGLDDIIIGATNILPTTVYLRKGRGFESAEIEGLTGLKEFSESDIAILDIDSDNDNDVVILAGGYENANEEEYHHFLYENQNGRFVKKLLPIPQFPASVVRPVDFDQDGDLDLFVGSRVKKGMFPYANHSWLILNDKGRFMLNRHQRSIWEWLPMPYGPTMTRMAGKICWLHGNGIRS